MSNLKNSLFLAIGEGSRFFVVGLLQTSAQMFFHQTPGQPTPHITDRGMSTVTLGWVGDLPQRLPFRFHDGVVIFVDRCLPRVLIKVGFSLQSLPERGYLCALRGAYLKSAKAVP